MKAKENHIDTKGIKMSYIVKPSAEYSFLPEKANVTLNLDDYIRFWYNGGSNPGDLRSVRYAGINAAGNITGIDLDLLDSGMDEHDCFRQFNPAKIVGTITVLGIIADKVVESKPTKQERLRKLCKEFADNMLAILQE